MFWIAVAIATAIAAGIVTRIVTVIAAGFVPVLVTATAAVSEIATATEANYRCEGDCESN